MHFSLPLHRSSTNKTNHALWQKNYTAKARLASENNCHICAALHLLGTADQIVNALKGAGFLKQLADKSYTLAGYAKATTQAEINTEEEDDELPF